MMLKPEKNVNMHIEKSLLRTLRMIKYQVDYDVILHSTVSEARISI